MIIGGTVFMSNKQLCIVVFLLIVTLFYVSCEEEGQSSMLEYYKEHGIMTDPGEYEHLYAELPSDVAGLCRVVQSAVLHIFWTQAYGVELSEERKKEVTIRKVEDMLAKISAIDDRPLAFPREPEQRIVGNCRDYSVLLVSLLRHNGIPARARCGFATYFTPGKHEDHWICEYWIKSEKRWIRVDAQLDSLQMDYLKIEFDPHDLPKGTFRSGAETWRLCRQGELDPESCGIFDMKGLWFVQDDLVRDFMAFNKVEVLPWDISGIMVGPEAEISPEDFQFLDKITDLVLSGDQAFGEIRSLYEADERLRMPADWRP
jgi:hypothetical protein